MDSCQAPGRSWQHLNFCFPGKTEHFYWLRTKELCWEASAVSFTFLFVFLSSSKNAQKSKCSRHLVGAWHLLGSLFLNPATLILCSLYVVSNGCYLMSSFWLTQSTYQNISTYMNIFLSLGLCLEKSNILLDLPRNYFNYLTFKQQNTD